MYICTYIDQSTTPSPALRARWWRMARRYIYVCVCVCVCVYIYIYRYRYVDMYIYRSIYLTTSSPCS